MPAVQHQGFSALSPSAKGLGLRRGLMRAITQYLKDPISLGHTDPVMDFFEVAPENWIQWGGRHSKAFDELTQKFPFVSHGLSLSLGGPDPLRTEFITQVKHFLDTKRMLIYSEHLSYCSDGGQLYDLMPIPFTFTMVDYVANRIQQVQDLLQRRIAVENVSFYAPQASEMSELDFFLAVVKKADCDILLDVNNVFVNSVNHSYNPSDFIQQLPGERMAYYHIAGHYQESDDLIIDTHGADVVEPVWQLLLEAYRVHGLRPTLLERDFHFPEFAKLTEELKLIERAQSFALEKETINDLVIKRVS